MLYLVHLERPFHHARHYMGFVDTNGRDPAQALESRLAYHRAGRGSKLLRAVTGAGIPWGVVRIWGNGTRTDERRLKSHSSTRYCPACRGEAAYRRGRCDDDTAADGPVEPLPAAAPPVLS